MKHKTNFRRFIFMNIFSLTNAHCSQFTALSEKSKMEKVLFNLYLNWQYIIKGGNVFSWIGWYFDTFFSLTDKNKKKINHFMKSNQIHSIWQYSTCTFLTRKELWYSTRNGWEKSTRPWTKTKYYLFMWIKCLKFSPKSHIFSILQYCERSKL